MKYEELLSRITKELGLTFNDTQNKQMLRFVSEIELFNPKYKLVGAEGDDILIRHIGDCLAAVPAIERSIEQCPDASFADVGSGAGFPGIVLAIAFPNNKFTLIERMNRRVSFLTNVIAALRLNDRVRVVSKDLKDVDEKFDVVTFRAFHPLFDIMDDISNICKDTTRVCAYKAKADTLLAELGMVDEICKTKWISTVEELHVPLMDASRKLCILQRAK
jgi:16S rRNA (guanine527-N7)-methyltransferase